MKATVFSDLYQNKNIFQKSLQIPICRAIIAFAFGLWGLKSKAGLRYRWGISAVGRTNHQQLRPASSSSYRRICTKFGRDFWGISAVGSARHSHCRGQRFESAMLHSKPRHFALVFFFTHFLSKTSYRVCGSRLPHHGK